MRLLVVTALASVAGVFSSPGSARADGPHIPTEELLNNWKRLDDADRVSRHYHVARSALHSKSPPLQVTVCIRPDRWLYKTKYQETAANFCRCPSYSFLIWQEPNKPGWVLRGFEGPPADTTQTSLEEATKLSPLRRPLGTLFTVAHNDGKQAPTLYEISQSPTFRVTRVTPKGGALDQVEFEYAGTTGVLLTDRSRSSLVIQSSVRGGTNTPGSIPWFADMKRREVEPGPDGRTPFRCRLIEVIVGNIGDPPDQHNHKLYEFTDYSDAPVPDEVFTLSHYGLPEPVGVAAKKRVPNTVWFLLAAAGCGVAAAGLRYAARRRSSPA